MSKTVLTGLVILLATMITPLASLAQSAGQVVMLYHTSQEQSSDLALEMVFTINGPDGRAIPEADIEAVTVRLGSGEPVEATVEKMQTDYYVTLLIDTSASMQRSLSTVQKAAKAAIDRAPSNVYFAVIQVDDKDQTLVPFTNDHGLVKEAIDKVRLDERNGLPTSTTCLYRAVYNAVELLDRATPGRQERRAVILLTDGHNERKDQLEVCNTHTQDQVISLAKPADAFRTPIYTIGLCQDDPCSNLHIHIMELTALSKQTFGGLKTGTQAELGALFRQAVETLGAQWAARANVPAGQGDNQAVLAVKVRGGDAPLTTAFTFTSKRDYDVQPVTPDEFPAPPPTPQPVIPRLEIGSLSYEEGENSYLLSMSVANPQVVDRLGIKVEENGGGILVLEQQIVVDGRPTRNVKIEAANLKPEQDYIVTVSALDRFSHLIEFEKDETLTPVRAVKEFRHDPPEPQILEFSLESVTPNYETGQLIINLDINSVEQELIFEGFINDETGRRVHNFERRLFSDSQLIEPLPAAMQQEHDGRKYLVNVFLSTKDDQRFGPQRFEMKPIPPPAPGLLQNIWRVLQTPVVFVPILIILISLIGWGLIKMWSNNDKPHPPLNPNIVRPPVG